MWFRIKAGRSFTLLPESLIRCLRCVAWQRSLHNLANAVTMQNLISTVMPMTKISIAIDECIHYPGKPSRHSGVTAFRMRTKARKVGEGVLTEPTSTGAVAVLGMSVMLADKVTMCIHDHISSPRKLRKEWDEFSGFYRHNRIMEVQRLLIWKTVRTLVENIPKFL